MTENDNGIQKKKIGIIIVAVIVIVAISAGAGLYIHSKQVPSSTSKSTVITVAFPVYSTTVPTIDNFLNHSMSGWLKAHPNVKIEFVGPFGASSEGQYYTKLDLMTSSKSTAPDVMLEDMFYTATYASSGTIMPLNNIINSSVLNSFYPSAIGQMTINGTYYGLPAQVTDTLIYYNMTLFQEAGIPTPWQPQNWTDIINAAMTLKEKLPSNVIPLNIYTGVQGDEASSFTGFESLLYGTGWGLYNFSTHQWYGDNPGLQATLGFYQKVFVNDSLAQTALSNTPYITAGQYMQEGKLGIDIDGSWMFGYQWANGSQNYIHNFSKYIGIAKIPTEFGQGNGYTTMVGGWGWSAYSGDSNTTLIGSFLTALDNITNQITINLPGNALAGGLPTSVNATSNPLFSELMPANPQLDTFYTNLLQYGSYRPPVATYPTVSYDLQEAMDTVTSGGSVASALSQYSSALVSAFGSSNVQSAQDSTVTATSAASFVPAMVVHTNNANTLGKITEFVDQEYYTMLITADSTVNDFISGIL